MPFALLPPLLPERPLQQAHHGQGIAALLVQGGGWPLLTTLLPISSSSSGGSGSDSGSVLVARMVDVCIGAASRNASQRLSEAVLAERPDRQSTGRAPSQHLQQA
jgi:hypothetical protein